MLKYTMRTCAAVTVGALLALPAAFAQTPPDPNAATPPPAATPPAAAAPKADAPKAETPKDAAPAAAPAAGDPKAAAPAAGGKTLAEAVKAEKGSLKNPFGDDPKAAEEGKKIYFGNSCNGCHGGGGGGGMCPPLTNPVWIYGSDDDTLFRLIALGSVELQKAGYTRKGREGVVGPMPPYLELIDSDEKLWKIISWIRTVNPASKPK